jgi:hypothetical protein
LDTPRIPLWLKALYACSSPDTAADLYDAGALRAAMDFERAAKTGLDLANQQTQSGNANVLLLLNAEQAYLQASIQVVQACASRLSDTAALFTALGGGWWNREEPPVEKVLDVGTGQANAPGERTHRR